MRDQQPPRSAGENGERTTIDREFRTQAFIWSSRLGQHSLLRAGILLQRVDALRETPEGRALRPEDVEAEVARIAAELEREG